MLATLAGSASGGPPARADLPKMRSMIMAPRLSPTRSRCAESPRRCPERFAFDLEACRSSASPTRHGPFDMSLVRAIPAAWGYWSPEGSRTFFFAPKWLTMRRLAMTPRARCRRDPDWSSPVLRQLSRLPAI